VVRKRLFHQGAEVAVEILAAATRLREEEAIHLEVPLEDHSFSQRNAQSMAVEENDWRFAQVVGAGNHLLNGIERLPANVERLPGQRLSLEQLAARERPQSSAPLPLA